MAQTQELKRRIRSVKNAGQLTKALEVVAASRMRKVVGLVDSARTYGELAASIMSRIAPNPEIKELPYFAPAADKPTLYVVFSSDRGQAGAFNTNAFNLALSSIRTERQKPHVIVYGRKGERFFSRLAGIELRGVFEDLADAPDVNVFSPAMKTITQAIENGEISKLIIVYTEFISSLSQKATAYQLLPVDLPTVGDGSQSAQKVYELEPETRDVLEEGIRLYLEAKLMQAKIESAAAEHAMRMVAMGNANRNAKDLVDSLTLELNTVRQAAITQEIAEITGGAAAIAQ